MACQWLPLPAVWSLLSRLAWPTCAAARPSAASACLLRHWSWQWRVGCPCCWATANVFNWRCLFKCVADRRPVLASSLVLAVACWLPGPSACCWARLLSYLAWPACAAGRQPAAPAASLVLAVACWLPLPAAGPQHPV